MFYLVAVAVSNLRRIINNHSDFIAQCEGRVRLSIADSAVRLFRVPPEIGKRASLRKIFLGLFDPEGKRASLRKIFLGLFDPEGKRASLRKIFLGLFDPEGIERE
ncbi:hypothetical protein FJY63_11900 [Candidatus Sumerlaeota bacterium]|nr:hypothetical protein [Candidatus Sumerlaeota bacterium]